ncbi:MAG: 3-hydroxyacyl-ACP dehydratase FabZ [Abditibacteriales bacterium]|nr:3-hydroxyacyl-ACP dehydratase FabZ [Abditibacteriales bacterium]
MLTIEQIQAILPHRYPFLLVDRIIELTPGERAVGVKNVTADEYFFPGHFPHHVVMPGVLVLEAMAQVGGVLMLSMEQNKGKWAYFGGVDKVRFRKPVVPGDQLVTEATLLQSRGDVGLIRVIGRVGGEVAAEGECLFVLRPVPE